MRVVRSVPFEHYINAGEDYKFKYVSKTAIYKHNFWDSQVGDCQFCGSACLKTITNDVYLTNVFTALFSTERDVLFALFLHS